jgi:hypothetical protein
MLGAGRAVVTPTALFSASRIVFSRQDKSRARDVVLQNIFGRWVAVVCANRFLVVAPLRPIGSNRLPRSP